METAELKNLLDQDGLASSVANKWFTWDTQRAQKKQEWRETREFCFATDTTKTSNRNLPWRNTTTLPKLAQIRDNLHANYLAALFPNDDWLKWEGYGPEDDTKKKKIAIQAYMQNKLREANFRTTVSQLVYDYIDYGNVIGDVKYVNESKVIDDEEIPGYIGPVAIRVSPNDIVFNPTASTFAKSPKITRSVVSYADLLKRAAEWGESQYLAVAMPKIKEIRTKAGSYKVEDFEKSSQLAIDGFGNLQEYYQSDYVEILELEGDIYDPDTDTLLVDYIVTVVDRAHTIRVEQLSTWKKGSSKVHCGWRLRPDNLWAMGPLDNLVGMQYRVDHLENLKADAWDQIAFPIKLIKGDVREFDITPGADVYVGEDGDVSYLTPDATFIQSDTQIMQYLQKMEEFAGSPKEAMGFRTPGEKTAFEVQTLASAALRIFQEKITNFEINVLEPLLNNMLEAAKRNLDVVDVARVIDNDLGVVDFIEITKEDITARGKLRPVGARHFAAQSKMLQDLTALSNSGVGQMVAPHMSGKSMSRLVEDILQLERFDLFKDNVAVEEQLETQRLANQAQEQADTEQAIGQGEDLEDIA